MNTNVNPSLHPTDYGKLTRPNRNRAAHSSGQPFICDGGANGRLRPTKSLESADSRPNGHQQANAQQDVERDAELNLRLKPVDSGDKIFIGQRKPALPLPRAGRRIMHASAHAHDTKRPHWRPRASARGNLLLLYISCVIISAFAATMGSQFGQTNERRQSQQDCKQRAHYDPQHHNHHHHYNNNNNNNHHHRLHRHQTNSGPQPTQMAPSQYHPKQEELGIAAPEQRKLNELISAPTIGGDNDDNVNSEFATRGHRNHHQLPGGLCNDCLAIPLVAIMGERRMNGYIIPNMRKRTQMTAANANYRNLPYVNQLLDYNEQRHASEPMTLEKKVAYERRGHDDHQSQHLKPKSDEKCPMTGPLTVCDQIGSYPADLILQKVESAKKELEGTLYFNIDSLFSDERSHSSEPFEDDLTLVKPQTKASQPNENLPPPSNDTDVRFANVIIAKPDPSQADNSNANIDPNYVQSQYTQGSDADPDITSQQAQEVDQQEQELHHHRYLAAALEGPAQSSKTSSGRRGSIQGPSRKLMVSYGPKVSGAVTPLAMEEAPMASRDQHDGASQRGQSRHRQAGKTVAAFEVSPSSQLKTESVSSDAQTSRAGPAASALEVDDFLTVVQRRAIQLPARGGAHAKSAHLLTASSSSPDRYREVSSDTVASDADNGFDDDDNNSKSHYTHVAAAAAAIATTTTTNRDYGRAKRVVALGLVAARSNRSSSHLNVGHQAKHYAIGRQQRMNAPQTGAVEGVDPIYDNSDPLSPAPSKNFVSVPGSRAIESDDKITKSALLTRSRRQVATVRVDASSGQSDPERAAVLQPPGPAQGSPNAANQPQAEPVCRAKSIYISPKAALNDKKQWKYVVNAPERNPKIRQIIRVDICEDPFGPCSDQVSLPLGFTSQCKQKYSKKKLLALDSQSGLLEVDTFFIPSCCVCQLIPDRQPSLEGPGSAEELDRPNNDSASGDPENPGST